MSRKLREGVSIQINEGKIYNKAVLFLGEEFVRITEEEEGQKLNTYYDWTSIGSIRTYSPLSADVLSIFTIFPAIVFSENHLVLQTYVFEISHNFLHFASLKTSSTHFSKLQLR